MAMTSDCPFCNAKLAEATRIHAYKYWNLFLQSEEKRLKTKGSAGFLASNEHIENPTLAPEEAWAELKTIISDASARLCLAAGMKYMGSETVGFNQGVEAGQTVSHAHIHILPSTEEDPKELRNRGGIGGAFEELRKNRTNS